MVHGALLALHEARVAYLQMTPVICHADGAEAIQCQVAHTFGAWILGRALLHAHTPLTHEQTSPARGNKTGEFTAWLQGHFLQHSLHHVKLQQSQENMGLRTYQTNTARQAKSI